MKILIYGTTEAGYMAALHLSPTHDVTVLAEKDQLPERFGGLDIGFISGSGTDIVLLQQTKADRGDLFIACSEIDEANIVACWTIKRIADIETICFVQKIELYCNIEYFGQSRFRTAYDIDTIVWPERLLTQDIFRVVSVPEALDVEYFAKGQVKLFEYRIKEDSIILDKRVMDCEFPKNVLIVGITRENELFIPQGSTVIELNDKVVIMGTDQALDLLAARIFRKNISIRKAVVIGGGSVGFLLSEQLESAGIQVTIIERDEQRCTYLADNLKKSLVLCGDGTDLNLLEDEAVGAADVVVCVTDNDEKNLLCSLLIKHMSNCRIITRVSNSQTAMLFERAGVDVVVSTHNAALKDLLNHVQSQDIDILALIEDGQGEVVRINVPEGYQETKVADITFKARAVIAVVQRGRQIIIPNGDTVIHGGDLLKLFTLTADVEAIQATFAK
jgi:trk system potassium uptake protein TrkA